MVDATSLRVAGLLGTEGIDAPSITGGINGLSAANGKPPDENVQMATEWNKPSLATPQTRHSTPSSEPSHFVQASNVLFPFRKLTSGQLAIPKSRTLSPDRQFRLTNSGP